MNTSDFSSYILEIYDAEEYTGPNPIRVKGMGIINGPENRQYFVVEPDQQIIAGRLTTNHFAVRAHYDDSINQVTDSVTTVSIVLLKNDNIDIDHTYNFNDLKFWKVGKLSPRI